MNLAQAISKRIRALLVEKGITQYRVEQNMQIDHGTMTGVMRGKNKGGNIRTIFLICRGLGVTPGEFFNDPLFEDTNLEID